MASPEHNRATIADVARRANVSIATVSRVINDTGQVAEETRQRVVQAVQDLHYTPQAAAKGLASRRTHMIGLVVQEINGTFFQPMLRGIEEATRDTGYDLLIHATHNHSEGSGNRYALGSHNTDGLIVYVDSMDDEALLRLYDTGFPLVLLYRTSPHNTMIPCILIENEAGTHRIVTHLIRLGRRRIAFLQGPPGNEDSHWRHIGYRKALAEYGLPYDDTLVGYGGFVERHAYATLHRWLEEGRQFDAVFSGSDDAALGVFAALREHGYRIPEDVAVVGFDDIPTGRHLTPALTTVHSPIEEAGHQSAAMLMAMIHGEQPEQRVVRLPVDLVVRQSCGT